MTEPTPQAVAGPAGPAPIRPAFSIRRTSTIDMTWPDGQGTAMQLQGSARDAVTLEADLAPVAAAIGSFEARIGVDRTIDHIATSPTRAGAAELIGCRGGGHLRGEIDRVLPGEREMGTPLYLLLDDISGSSLIGGFAWSRHSAEWTGTTQRRESAPRMENVCIGFKTGNSSLVEITSGTTTHRTRAVPALAHPDDPDGWHELAELPEVSMRRARRIDVWRGDGVIMIDSSFQDSAADPSEGRVAVHEYSLRATADPTTATLLTVDPEPRILPFMECPNAVASAQTLVGSRLGELRSVVLERLAKERGCTHLNDALRALAEVPVLLDQLDDHMNRPVEMG